MNMQARYLAHLKRYRPRQYKALKAAGELEKAAQDAVDGYQASQKHWEQLGKWTLEMEGELRRTYLEPMSEREEAEEVARLEEAEREAAEEQADALMRHLQGIDPRAKGRQEYYLGDGRRVVKQGNLTTVYPATFDPATIASTPKKLGKAEPSPNTETT